MTGRGPSAWRWVSAVIALALVAWGALSVVRWVNTRGSDPSGALFGALGLVLAAWTFWWQSRQTAADKQLQIADRADQAARTLEQLVRAAEGKARLQLLGTVEAVINVHYRPWARKGDQRAQHSASTAPRTFANIADFYSGIPTGRLVITGDPGSGKTVLALELIAKLLTPRRDGGPVPIRLSLTEWDLSRRLDDWLYDTINERFPTLRTIARHLIEQNMVMPVLDGLDEMDRPGTDLPTSRAARALALLNAGDRPVVLTCRTSLYGALNALPEPVELHNAARAFLKPLTPVQAKAYLVEQRKVDTDSWQPVLLALDRDPTLARALNTPWRLNLAATIYESSSGRSPAGQRPGELTTLGSENEIRDHLLGGYIAAAVAATVPNEDRELGRKPEYTARQTQLWLYHLAHHLQYGHGRNGAGPGTDLVLHRLWPMAGARRVRALNTCLAAALTALALAASTIPALSAGFFFKIRDGHADFQDWVTAVGIALVVASVLARSMRAHVPEPKLLRWNRLRTPAGLRNFASGFARGLLAGLIVGFVVGLAVGLAVERQFGLAFGFGFALTYALVVGCVVGLTADRNPDTTAVVSPLTPLRSDLLVGSTFGIVFWLAFWCAVGLSFTIKGGWSNAVEFWGAVGIPDGWAPGLLGGLAAGCVFGSAIGYANTSSRYLSFLLVARVRGILPLRLGRFMLWAYQAELLRTSGTAYQLRHRELQEWLAMRSTPAQE